VAPSAQRYVRHEKILADGHKTMSAIAERLRHAKNVFANAGGFFIFDLYYLLLFV